jgi:hypothetical protein
VSDRFIKLKLHCAGSFEYQENHSGDYFNASAGFPLFLIREAWSKGCSFERECNGFGPDEGTHGDWSAIRDSTPDAVEIMTQKALNFLFPA